LNLGFILGDCCMWFANGIRDLGRCRAGAAMVKGAAAADRKPPFNESLPRPP